MSNPVPVYILHWNRPQECLRAIESFFVQGVPIHITVIDNASNPDRLKTLSDGLPSGVELLRLDENLGWGKGFNVVLAKWLQGKEDYCFVSAHDALPQPDCLRMLLDAMQNDAKVGIACPEYGVPHVAKFSPILGARLPHVSPRKPGTIETMVFPHGTLTAFKRQCLAEIGLFDERYFAYGDDIEIGLRATRRKWKVVVVWGARVVNPGGWTPTRTRSYLHTRNSLLLAQTHGGWLPAVLRALFIFPNTLRLWLTPSARPSAFSPEARLLAVRDFFLGRFGRPPEFRK